jgi:two-component system chemotaxis sensor kinase CheA
MTDSNEITGKAIKDFLAEAEEIIDQLSLDLVGLSDFSGTDDYNPDLLNSVFRGAHSLKGLAGMFGFLEIAELAHNLENLLDSLRLGKVTLSQTVMGVLFDAMELLGNLVRNAGSESVDTQAIAQAVARIDSCIKAEKSDVASPLSRLGLPANLLGTLTEYEEHRLLENMKKGKKIYSIRASFSLATFDQELGELTDLLKKEGEVISTLPSAGGGLGGGIDFEILYGSVKGPDDINAMVEGEKVKVTRVDAPELQEPSEEAPEAPAAAAEETALTAKSFSRTVRVDIAKLDELMNIVGELVLSQSTVTDLADRLKREGYSTLGNELSKAAKGLERKLSDLQKGVMDIRMIPVGQLFEKMSRIVRKISREQGKQVDLKMFGAETELDKLIIEDISDPMMHIIRNAIDHGIETPDERARNGKAEKGLIRLSSFQKGNHVVIEVEDDGRGIDLAKVKRKGVEMGLIPSVDAVSDRDALDFLFVPGFSTSEKISEISGRGVGMDVVKNNIAAVSGMVDIENSPGRGCKVTITLPITLAIIKALIIEATGRKYAVPITSVLETIMVARSDVLTVERKEVIQLREATLPLLNLGRFFEIEGGKAPSNDFFVVVVGVAEKRLGVMVDELLGQQDIVIKSIGETFKGFRGISGAADLGDQRTILVLDVGGIINEATRGNG